MKLDFKEVFHKEYGKGFIIQSIKNGLVQVAFANRCVKLIWLKKLTFI